HVLNLDRLEYSRRVNPLHPRYITTLADATETAETLIHALLKSEKSSGSAQFFTQSAINFVAACIYYFATYRMGKYSTLPHVLAFINQPYENIFNTLFDNPELHALLAPFRSAFDNRAFDQLEGQVGTVRVNISRIATKEAFWVFSAEDFDLKISNPASVLVMANSPQTQNINSAFYSVVVNRVTKLVNTKGNNPTALVIDETPTIYLHKVENLIATARSNKVAVVLGLQELPQFHQQYGKDVAHSITSIMGTILSGSVRNKETLDWLEKLFGKVKQTATGVSVSHEKANVNLNERMDSLIPAAKIAGLNAGELVGLVSRESSGAYDGSYVPNVFNCKIALDMAAIEGEKKAYRELPEIYNFGDSEQKAAFLLEHMQRIYTEVESILL
ncbi:Type IV secretion-system coupling protein DNA-binding domain-containing protein, partial [Cnuella takakiae]